MARPKRIQPPTKDRRINLRVSNVLYDTLSKDAQASGLSLSDYIRSVLSNRKVIVKPEIVYNDPRILKALGDIGKIGSNLNQIAHQLNAGEAFSNSMSEQLRSLTKQLLQMRNEIKEMAGDYRGDC